MLLTRGTQILTLLVLGSLAPLIAAALGSLPQPGMGDPMTRTAPILASAATASTSAGTGALVQELVRDVAVIDIQPQAEEVLQGETVVINVVAQNRGTVQETFSVSLRDDTDARDIASVFITLDAGQALTIGFPWDTGRASRGEHILTATASTPEDQDPGNDSRTAATPVRVEIEEIVFGLPDDPNQAQPKAFFGGGLSQPDVVTQATPHTSVFIGKTDAFFGLGLSDPNLNTPHLPQESIFVANAGAVFPEPSVPASIRFQKPVMEGQRPTPGRVEGTVLLQGRDQGPGKDSRGGFVLVEDQVVSFLDRDGRFSFFAPGEEPRDLVITAPGYLSVVIQEVSVDAGQVLTIPELTLPYGDANGDGQIDILDLSISASNYGKFVEVKEPPE